MDQLAPRFAVLCLSAILLLACRDQPASGSGTGGAHATGGIAATGGQSGTGGQTASGGQSGGGGVGAGGSLGSGGLTASGGTQAGGTRGLGGVSVTGGRQGSGGTTATGGRATGGASADAAMTGGAPGSGGTRNDAGPPDAPGSGGSATGGTTARGGSGSGGASGASATGGITGTGGRPKVVAAPGATLVKVDVNIKHQSFEGWGTSLAWWAYQIGGWSSSKRNQFLDLIVNPATGLGYNIFRYNIGGGDDPAHDHMGENREMPGFQSSTGTWDWNADARQTAVLTQLMATGGDVLIEAFSNSPPYWMTKSGCASGNTDGSNNLKDDAYDDFATYLVAVTKHYRDVLGDHLPHPRAPERAQRQLVEGQRRPGRLSLQRQQSAADHQGGGDRADHARGDRDAGQRLRREQYGRRREHHGRVRRGHAGPRWCR